MGSPGQRSRIGSGLDVRVKEGQEERVHIELHRPVKVAKRAVTSPNGLGAGKPPIDLRTWGVCVLNSCEIFQEAHRDVTTGVFSAVVSCQPLKDQGDLGLP